MLIEDSFPKKKLIVSGQPNLDNVFDLGTGTLLGDSYLASTDH